MKLEICLIILLITISRVCSSDEKSFLDNFLPIFRIIKKISNDAFRIMVENPRNRQILKRNNKALEIPDNANFPCDLNIVKRSPVTPKTAHEVRPGDIDVIGALGDSLTAGFGASATSLLDVLSEDRGKSFSIGGQDTWRTSITLPNILKMFNPNLIGYSLRSSTTLDKESQFNVAEGGAISANMPYMANVLVNRIKSDPRVDIQRDWKMITFMIGDNDFCSEFCYIKNPEILLHYHKQDVLDVLRILKSNLPRTIVNIVVPPDLRLLTITPENPVCSITHSVECPCMGYSYRRRRKLFFDVMRRWQELDIEISNYPEFDLDDFTVIPHYFTLDFKLPTTRQGKIDYSFFSEDCFHFSEKGQSVFANNLWNSLMEPFGNKSTNGLSTLALSKFNCPTDRHPYVYTRRNSLL